MTEVQEKPTLSFDGKNYVIDDLSDQAKYFVGQVKDLIHQANATRSRLDQIEVGRRGFEDLLRAELEKPEEVPEGEVVQ